MAEELVGSTRASIELYLRHFLRHWSHDTDVFTDEEIAEFVEAYSQPGALRGGFNCYRAAFRAPGQDNSPIATPTRILWGDSDPILRFEWSDNLGEFFSNYTLKKIEGCGHFMHREAPERINQEIIEFLSD
jgi:pimeloyl-ACP methyl ester carboxylesterase